MPQNYVLHIMRGKLSKNRKIVKMQPLKNINKTLNENICCGRKIWIKRE
jgi:hypothetical protein